MEFAFLLGFYFPQVPPARRAWSSGDQSCSSKANFSSEMANPRAKSLPQWEMGHSFWEWGMSSACIPSPSKQSSHKPWRNKPRGDVARIEYLALARGCQDTECETESRDARAGNPSQEATDGAFATVNRPFHSSAASGGQEPVPERWKV